MSLHTFDLLICINSVDKFIDMTSLVGVFLKFCLPDGNCKVRGSPFGRHLPPPPSCWAFLCCQIRYKLLITNCVLVTIVCTKEGIRFSSSGELGSGNITLRKNASIDKEEEQVCR